MSLLLRPCSCERFVPGRPFNPVRDCTHCWLFAHRPSVRRAWGGDPAACAPLPIPNPEMPVGQLADLLQEPPFPMPEGWRFWPVTQRAHLLLAERFRAGMPAYPEGRFAGRGAVICGGGAYEASAYVACRMLRHVGWEHPIQVWHRGVGEPVSDRIRSLPGVEVVDTEAHPARRTRRLMGGWESKSLAILNSPFEEVLFLDADCYPIYNPDVCFEPENNPHGIVTWPDVPVVDAGIHWPTYGVAPDDKPALNGGHYVLSKRRSWPVWQLAAHYDNHSEYYYWHTIYGVEVGGFGDQEQVRAALQVLRAPQHRYTDRPLACAHESYLQAGPHGRPLFVHRSENKFGLGERYRERPRWYPGQLPMEATAWGYFLEWMNQPDGDGDVPEEVPGWFTPAECRLWGRLCQDRDVLEMGRYHGRSTVVAARTARLVVSLDRDSAWPADFWLQRHGVRHKVWLREGTFDSLVSSCGGPFTACLIDADHDRHNVAADIATALPVLAPGALIAFHDYDDPAHPDVGPTVDEAAARHGWRLLERADHLAVFALPS